MNAGDTRGKAKGETSGETREEVNDKVKRGRRPAYHHGALASGVQDMLFISGQVGMKEDGSVVEGAGAQAAQAMMNMAAVLKAADMDINNVAKFTLFVTDGDGVRLQATGVYRDRFVRADGRWRIAHRHLDLDVHY